MTAQKEFVANASHELKTPLTILAANTELLSGHISGRDEESDKWLENMKQDYVLYANVRGLPQRSILVKHILKNSMHTCIVAMGMSIPQLISGTIVVENVFSWPGLGTLCISSIFNRDYPVIQTYVLLIGVLFVLFNLLFDILQTVSDPRLRKED